jgi:hypothetical protein
MGGIHRDPELNSHGAVVDENVRSGDETDTAGPSTYK